MQLAEFRAPAAVGAAGLVAVGALRLRDPHIAGSYGGCPFLALTGQPCPGCGGLRAVNDLAHGDLLSALSSNALAVVLLFVLFGAWILWVMRRARGTHDRMLVLTARAGMVVLAGIVVFGVIRVTPWGSWLAP